MRKISRLIATGPLTYGTRRLQAGDLFDADPRHAGVLTIIGKARPAGEGEAAVGAPIARTVARAPAAEPAGEGETSVTRLRATKAEMAALRAAYARAAGEEAPAGWPAARLRRFLAGLDTSDEQGGTDGQDS